MNRRMLWPALALTAVTLAASAYAADRAPAPRAPAPQAAAPTVAAPAEPDSPGDAIAPDEWMAGLAGDDEWLDSDDAAGPGMAGGRLTELRLTDEQRQKLEDVRYRHQKKVIPMQSDLRLAAVDLRHLMRAENPDAHAINAQIDRIAGMRASVGKERVASMLEARAILTPEQRKMWRERAAMGGMRGMRGMRGAPGARGREMMMRRGPGGGGDGGDGPEGHDL
jgi:Spy/CpxP family protein refolding chaperone